jgi:hypothetical protein
MNGLKMQRAGPDATDARTARLDRAWWVLAGLWMLALTLLTGGCASVTSVSAEVSSFGNWPQGRKPGRYVFERLPSQEGQADVQTRLEAAARPVLAAAGFELAKDAQQADFSVQVAAQIRLIHRHRPATVWVPYGSPGYGYPPRVGYGAYGPRGAYVMTMTADPLMYQMQVDLLIRDRQANQVLYETHARNELLGAVDETLYPYLFEAALKDFPLQAVSPRSVTIPIPRDNH